MPKKIAIMTAMPEEMEPLRALLQPKEIYHNKVVHIEQAGDLLLLQSGIGKANAAAACALLFQLFKPAALLNIGSAGGFAHDLHFGDVVVATELLYSDADATCFNYRLGQVPQMPPTYPADPQLLAAAQATAQLPRFAGHIRFGQVLTSDIFMSSPSLADRLRQEFPQALASDMEGCAAAQIAYTFGTPFLNLRSISDIAGEEAAASFDDNLELAANRAVDFCRTLLDQLREA